jgi:NAD dependent epimerase/dehydratase
LIKPQKILVTGADGFIGSHLVEYLMNEGHQIKAFVCYNSFNSWGWLDTLSSEKRANIEIFTGDVRDPNGVRKAVENIDMVFHLAALIGIPYSYHSPDSYVDTNIKGTLNVLQACRDSKVQRLVVTSTSEVYGTAQYVPIDEKHPLQPQSPYSATKIAADSISESFYRTFELPVVIARPFNTYGPRQSARAIIPTIIAQLLQGQMEIRLGSLSPTRDFTFVEDTCKGFWALATQNDKFGMPINIGSNNEISMGKLAELLIQKINPKATTVCDAIRLRPGKSEVERLVCNNNLIKKITKWEPEISLEAGLERTIQWFKENKTSYKAQIYNV